MKNHNSFAFTQTVLTTYHYILALEPSFDRINKMREDALKQDPMLPSGGSSNLKDAKESRLGSMYKMKRT